LDITSHGFGTWACPTSPLHLTPPHLCHPHTNWCRPFGQSHLMASVLGPVQPASISPASSASPPTSWHRGPFGQSYPSHSHLMALVLEPVQPAHLHPPHLRHPHTSWHRPFRHRISWLWYLGLSNQPPLHLTCLICVTPHQLALRTFWPVLSLPFASHGFCT